MIPNAIYSSILKSKKLGNKQFAVLIDPDKFHSTKIIKLAEAAGVDYFMVGGSLISSGNFDKCIDTLRSNTSIPIIIFPGNNLQISKHADAILLLSLISGRNPDFLIGQHVIGAPFLKSSGLEIIPTGYMLIESEKQSAASYMSNTLPIPNDKYDIAMSTALAGEMLGLKLIYMDAGSGVKRSIASEMIKKVRSVINIPLVIGGGINTPEKAVSACKAGGDIIVVGNALEKEVTLIKNISKAIHKF